MKNFLLILSFPLISCQMSNQENNTSDLTGEETSTSYAHQSGTLSGVEGNQLLNQIATYEDLIGTPEEELEQLFGNPIDVEFREGAIDERDATVYFFEYPVSELSNIYLSAAVQHGILAGIQVSSRENSDLIYSATRYLLAGRGITWTPAGNSRHKHVARSGDHLMWQIDFEQTYYGRTAIVNVGTYKYSMCELAWDAENLWGTDGLGNPIHAENGS